MKIDNPKCIVVGELTNTKFESFNRVHSAEGICPSILTMQGGGRQPKIIEYETERDIRSKPIQR